MEFWVVVAAAGAGCVAQYLQSSSDNKDNLLEQKQFPKISTHEQSDNKNLMHQVREFFCPFRRLARKRAKNEVSDEGVFRFRHLNLDSSANFEFAVECKPEDYTGREHAISRNKVSSRSFNSTGVSNEVAVLYMGIITGMMSAIIANRREIEKVNEKLKLTKNLVEELQEELTVKEVNEKPNLYSLSVSDIETVSSSSEVQVNETTRLTSENTNHVVAENHESMSEIEAELEAELERLEMSMKFESISDFVELDSEDEVDVAQGEFKLDCLNMQYPDSLESDCDTNATRIYHHSKPANYPVSPRELSSRLHEVIESRLEAQIKDLETALYHSQIRACSLEAQHILSQMDYASSESESSAYSQSPYYYHEANEDTIRTMHGSETTFEIDIKNGF